MSDLFGSSGIRGLVNEVITPEFAVRFSKSLATELGGSGRIMVGRDTRVSGEMLENVLTGSLLSAGLDVTKGGVVPTPVLAFATRREGADAGLMITASHNPPEYNGVKLFGPEGMPFSKEKEQGIESSYYNREFQTAGWNEIGSTGSTDLLKPYLNQMAKEVSVEGDYKVAVDCSSGPSCRATPRLLGDLGCDVVTINSHLDGRFPGREAEPVDENLGDLKELVLASGADIGFAHDGDGDRVAVVDDEGKFVGMDKLLALIGRYSVERFGGGIVTTVDASKMVDKEVSKAGGNVLRTPVGDVNVSREMHSKGIKFGGEPSGSWIMGDIHFAADGTLAAARIMEILDSMDEPISRLVGSIPSYPIVRDKVECANEKKEEAMKAVDDQILSSFDNVQDVLTEDGIRLELKGGDWVLVRPSGTEPYIRITAEADEEADAEGLADRARKVLEEAVR